MLVERLEAGRLVDVSMQFPAVIAADARSLTANTHTSWYKTDGVFAFIGELEAWVADECRLGNGAAAWGAEQEIAHGAYRQWMASIEPHYIAQLRADLVDWGYCSTAS